MTKTLHPIELASIQIVRGSGLGYLMEKFRNDLYQRYEKWFMEKLMDYIVRRDHLGTVKALKWLSAQCATPELSDRRKETKTASRDETLLHDYASLMGQIRAEFMALTRSTKNLVVRNEKLARIVSEALGREIPPADLPLSRSLSSVCQAILKTTPLQLNRARKRLARVNAEKKAVLYDWYALLAKSHDKGVRRYAKAMMKVHPLAPRQARAR
ncbi:hypothetical protein DNFV4_02559 [Nitrospira tepida]|uniref:Uncharacterized protein n=1 Tax=Nitrospira tepida TaxID=2973512 RepID=A0AA86T5Q4_9BACT|nr:hypothetical protein [Nitrospira tepida]CAI4032132.1 hypothetical protein DNFV4_02559 [Nitrospira tepida]